MCRIRLRKEACVHDISPPNAITSPTTEASVPPSQLLPRQNFCGISYPSKILIFSENRHLEKSTAKTNKMADLFNTIGEKAEKVAPVAVPNGTTEDEDEKVVEEIESLCMNCGENVSHNKHTQIRIGRTGALIDAC